MSKIDPFIQKVLLTLLAVGVVAVGQKFFPAASEWFTGAGGTIFGGAWMRSPGDVKAEAAS